MDNFDCSKFVFSEEHILGDNRFTANVSDYSFKFRTPTNNLSYSDDIKLGLANYNLFLQHKGLDSAVVGFDVFDSNVVCSQIQGGQRRFRQLTPIAWDKLLLENLILLSRESGMDSVQVMPAHLHDVDLRFTDFNKLKKRYDLNAQSLGFQYRKDLDRFFLDLK